MSSTGRGSVRRTSKIVALATVILSVMPLTAHADPAATHLTAKAVARTWVDPAAGGAGGGLDGAMRATLTDAAGVPLPNQLITFTLHQGAGCSAVTDGAGQASCGQGLGGYRASFAGNETYAASQTEGCTVVFDGPGHACALGYDNLLHAWVD